MCYAHYIFHNGNVFTADNRNPWAEAVAVRGRYIMAVGRNHQIMSLQGPGTRIYDLQGKSLLPGFNDAHNHMLGYGLFLKQIDTRYPQVRSIEDIKRKIKERAATLPPGEWILARGYDDSRLLEGVHPQRRDLDEAAPHNPVFLKRTCGHLCVVNSRALECLSLEEHPELFRYQHIQTRDGVPTGILKERALDLVLQALPTPSFSDYVEALEKVNEHFIRHGITSSQDAGIGEYGGPEVEAFRHAVETGRLKVRTYLMYMAGHRHGKDWAGTLKDTGLSTGFGDDRLRLGSVKLLMDGSVGGKTAAMFAPYPGEPDNYGITIYPQDELDRIVEVYHDANFQLAIHAIGDRAITMVIEAVEKAACRKGSKNLRHRIEHCGTVNADILDRMARGGIIAVPQPIFLYSFGDNYRKNLSLEMQNRLYPLKTFLTRGIPIAGSSDSPVADFRPLQGIQTAVTRRTLEGQVLCPGEALTLKEAIIMYTLGGAYASHEENIKGSLEPGKLADLIVLSENIFQQDPLEMEGIDVEMTMIDGSIVFEGE